MCSDVLHGLIYHEIIVKNWFIVISIVIVTGKHFGHLTTYQEKTVLNLRLRKSVRKPFIQL